MSSYELAHANLLSLGKITSPETICIWPFSIFDLSYGLASIDNSLHEVLVT